MSATELALLQLNDGISFASEETKSALREMKVMASGPSNVPCTLRYQVEDATQFYMLRACEQAESGTLQTLFNDYKHLFSVIYLIRINVNVSSLPLNAGVMAIGRHFILPGKAAEFMSTFNAVKYTVEQFPALRGMSYGWRLDGEYSHQEWVQFSGWDEVAQHRTFPQSEGFKEYAKIRPLVESIDVRHAYH